MDSITCDVVILGAGGAGLRAAIALAEADPSLSVALISKVYPMRSHTCAAEGGAAGVIGADDSFDLHFLDTIGGSDWLADQDAVEGFIKEAPVELARLERWGCPWSRDDQGRVAVRPFGGMKIRRTWYAADKTGFHILHTLFQTSLQFENITRYDEHFTTDLIVGDGRVQGCIAIDMASGAIRTFQAKAVIVCTGGASRMYPFTTNGSIKTGDGTALAYRAGVPLKDMEFVQYHPTGLPGTGILLTEGCRGEGGVLRNRHGDRYLKDYGMGPETPLGEPVLKTMELGPRDRLSQAFWHEQQKGNTLPTKWGDCVHLDLRHLGEERINERLPFVRDLAKSYLGVDMVTDPVPIRPVVHYMMGGIHTDVTAATPLTGLFAAGECACVSINGANRLGSNSLTELLVFGRRAAEGALAVVRGDTPPPDAAAAKAQTEATTARIKDLFDRDPGTETVVDIRTTMTEAMETGAGIYRTEDTLKDTCATIATLRRRYKSLAPTDKTSVFNTDLFQILELGAMLDLAETVAQAALARTESRGAHQRLDHPDRDDEGWLKHSMAHYQGEDPPRIDSLAVTITSSAPGLRDYSGGK